MEGFKVEVRADHNPPHFHVTGVDADLMVDLRTFEILRGSAPRRLAEQAISWAKSHQEELMAKWSELNARE
ncbi:MAG: DUF4160 domain-containing protein [Alphaproteobacteria bacterium]|nr:DUF4160 domain-containing protein [Alphaproteobacteria bacterium]